MNVGIDILDSRTTSTSAFPARTRRRAGQRPGSASLTSDGVRLRLHARRVRTAELVPPFKGTRIVPGFRADYTNAPKQWDFAPRVACAKI